jgi:hypothetical protein
MPDKPDQTKSGSKDPAGEKPGNPVESDKAGSATRSYYYDDAHGYKDFDPDDENEQMDEDDEA